MVEELPENSLFELLDQARRAETAVLPGEVRARLDGFDIVRLRLLTFRNVCTLGDFCAGHPEAWRIYKLKFQNPQITQQKLAMIVGCSATTVKRWLNCEPLAERDFYDEPLIGEI